MQLISFDGFVLFADHSEALTGMMLALQRSEPSNTLLSQVFMRDVYEKDLFTVSILKFWFRNHEKKVADIVGTALTKTLINDNTPTKRKKQAPNKQLSEASEFILGHLNILRKHLPVNSTCEYLEHEFYFCFRTTEFP